MGKVETEKVNGETPTFKTTTISIMRATLVNNSGEEIGEHTVVPPPMDDNTVNNPIIPTIVADKHDISSSDHF